MRKVRAADMKTELDQLLLAVEQGQSVVITRHGRPVARLTPDGAAAAASQGRGEDVRAVQDRIRAFRRKMPRLTVEEILSARHEGHRI
jgi:prevent-host-death family protein